MKHIVKFLFLLTINTLIHTEPDKTKLQEALKSAIKEEAVETVEKIIDAGAKPTADLLMSAQEQTLPISKTIYAGKTPDTFEKLRKNMKILKTLYKKGAEGTHDKLGNYIKWILDGSRNRDEKDPKKQFRDRDIAIFYEEFEEPIKKITPQIEE